MKKNKMILPALACLVLAVLIYIFIYRPFNMQVAVVKDELEMVELEYSVKQNRISSIPTLNKQIKELADINASRFYGETLQEEFIVKINDLCEATEVRILEVSYGGVSEFSLSPDAQEEPKEELNEGDEAEGEESEGAETEGAETDLGETEESEPVSQPIEAYEDEDLVYGDLFSVRFAGTYEQILTMLKLIDTNQKIIVNSGAEIDTDLGVTAHIPEELKALYPDVNFEELMIEDGVIACQFELIFFKVEGMEEDIIKDYNVLEEEPRGKPEVDSPFDVKEN